MADKMTQTEEIQESMKKIPGFFAGIAEPEDETPPTQPQEGEGDEASETSAATPDQEPSEEQPDPASPPAPESSDPASTAMSARTPSQEGDAATRQGQESDKKSKQKEPIVVLERHGQTIPVYDRETLKTLAQKGLNYGISMEALSAHRRDIEALAAHPDLSDELHRRMKGEAPRLVGGDDPVSDEDIPKQLDTETYDEYVRRVAKEVKARTAQKVHSDVTSRQQELALAEKGKEVLSVVTADPLWDQTSDLIRRAIDAGRIPKDVVQEMDRNPDVFMNIVASAKRAVVANIQQSRGRQEQAKPEPKKPKQTAPSIESGARRSDGNRSERRSLASVQAVRDMSNEDILKIAQAAREGRL